MIQICRTTEALPTKPLSADGKPVHQPNLPKQSVQMRRNKKPLINPFRATVNRESLKLKNPSHGRVQFFARLYQHRSALQCVQSLTLYKVTTAIVGVCQRLP